MVELIMVIVIIGILAAVAGPRFFDRQVFDERLFYEESLAALRYAQKLAVASGCPIRVVINGNGYALSYAQACGGRAAGAAVQDPSGADYQAVNSQGVAVDPTLELVFNSLGDAVGNAKVATFANTFSLRVHASTGFIETTP
jgi:MSHA pilin protein MshC